MRTNYPLALALALALAACAEFGDGTTSDPSADELSDGLAELGKADAAGSDVTIFRRGIGLRGSVARALYDRMSDAGVPARTGNGLRLVRGTNTACITNGEASYCELRGPSSAGYGADFEGFIRGRAAAFLSSLDFDVWFSCARNGNRTRCGIERSELVTLEFEGLEHLGANFVYEGWAVTQEHGALTMSRFAEPTRRVHQRIARSVAALAVTYVLTIEPRRGDASTPAATHVLAGSLADGEMTKLTTEHPAALATDFADASGGYILATPSSADSSDETQGIWFVDPAAGAPSLMLPTLPQGWVYEGWVVGANGPVSTGRFSASVGPDQDGAGPAAGPEDAPPFAGQDFVSPAMELVGATVVISVEPEPDNSPAPFSIKPLVDVLTEGVAAPELQGMTLTSANRAHGWAALGEGGISRTGEVWTADRAGGTVSVVDVASKRTIANLVFGVIEPMYVNYAAGSSRVFVGDRANDRVLVIDSRTRAMVGDIAVGAGVFHQWVHPEGEQLWINNDLDRTTSVIDAESLEVLATIPMPADLAAMDGSPKPHDVFVSHSGDAAFVTYLGFADADDFIVRFDASTYTETHRAAIGKDPHVFAIEGQDVIFVPSQDSSEVAMLRTGDLARVGEISIPGAHGITGAKDGRIYIANTPGAGTDALFAIDSLDATLLNDDGVETPTGGKPHNLGLNGDGTRLFVTHSGATSTRVSIFEVSSDEPVPVLIDEVIVGRNPFGLGFVPRN